MAKIIDQLSSVVVASAVYAVRVCATLKGIATKPKPPLVLAFTFLDRNGQVIDAEVEGLLPSPLFGLYRYIGKPGRSGEIDETLIVRPPARAEQVQVSLHQWYAAEVALAAPLALRLVPVQGQSEERAAFAAERLMGVVQAPVVAGDGYSLRADFGDVATPKGRFALASVRFLDAGGQPMPAPEELLFSDAVGDYLYLNPQGDADGLVGAADMVAPEGAAHVVIQLLRWSAGARLARPDLSLVWLDDPARDLASGRLAVDMDQPVRLTLPLHPVARGTGPVALAEATFLDEANRPITEAVEGLRRDGLRMAYQAHLQDRPGPGGRWGDVCLTGLSFRPPPGTASVRWAVRRLEDKPEISLGGDARVGQGPDTPPTLLATLAAEQCIEDLGKRGSLAGLRGALPKEGALWRALAAGEMQLLGEYATWARPGRWLSVEASVNATSDDGVVLLVPTWFDAWGQPKGGRPLGCTMVDQAGFARLAVLRPEAGGTRFHEVFIAPEGAALVLVHAVFWPARADAQAALTAPRVAALSVDAVGEDLDPEGMSHTQLQCAVQIAEAVNHVPARAALHAALTAYETKPGGHTVQMRRLKSELRALDTGWLPVLPEADGGADPDGPALCLAARLGGEQGRRLSSLYGAGEAVIALPLSGEGGDGPDGFAVADHDGLPTHQPVLGAWAPEAMLPCDRLTLEARLFQQVVLQEKPSLIHAMSGQNGYDRALCGLALARRHGLPLIYERNGLHEHLWRPQDGAHLGNSLTRLRLRQEARLMREADRVIVPSLALKTELILQGADADRITVVPYGVPALFLDPLAPERREADRTQRGFGPETVLVGYEPSPARPAATTQVVQAMLALLGEGLPVQLLWLGSEPVPPECAALGPVSLPIGADAETRRAWVDMCDLVIAPSPPDRRSDHSVPLVAVEAMTRAVPVLLAARPFADELAGFTDERALRFEARDAKALAGVMQAVLAALPEARARAAGARDWACQTHGPDAVRAALAAVRDDLRRVS